MTYSWEQAKRWECSGLVDVCLNPLLAIHDPESSPLVQLFFLYCAFIFKCGLSLCICAESH